MDALRFFFWLLFAIIFYTYVGYTLLLLGVKVFKKRSDAKKSNSNLDVTLIIPCYNEEAVLDAKIQNALSLEYPKEKLTILIVSDGSTDGYAALVKKYPEVLLMHHPERIGKAAALNRAMEIVQTSVVVFSDANTLLNKKSLVNLLFHFSNPKVGAVAGEKKVAANSGMGSAEGWYWKYESFMKKLDASFHSVVGAAGELFALRTLLFTPLPEDTILDDLTLSMNVSLQGYGIAYEPEAFALEAPSASLTEEGNRKIRIAAGAFQLLARMRVKDFFFFPASAFQFVSRRWLRWVICPPALLLLLILNIILEVCRPSPLFHYLLATQLVFYGLAAIGWRFMKNNKAWVIVTVPFYFLFMNYCMIAGYMQYRQGKATVLWDKPARMAPLSAK